MFIIIGRLLGPSVKCSFLQLVPGFPIHTIVVQSHKSHRTVSATISFTILFISENDKYKTNEILSSNDVIYDCRKKNLD